MARRTGKAPARDPRADGALCSQCPLQGASPCVFGQGPARAKIAVVGEGPGRNEIERGIPFVGSAGEVLEEIAVKYNIPRSQIYIDNATLEMPPGGDLDAFMNRCRRQEKLKATAAGREPTKLMHPADCCRPRLFKALGIPKCSTCGRHRLGPGPCKCPSPLWVYPEGSDGRERAPVIVPTGNAALRALFGFEGILNWQASPINVDWWRRDVYKRRIRSDEV